MTKLSTVSYVYEPGLIPRLLKVALEAVNAYVRFIGYNCVVYLWKNRV